MTCIGVFFVSNSLSAVSCCFLIYNQLVSHIVVKAFSFLFLLFTQEYHMYSSLSIGVYSCRYYLVFLYFTNWLISHFYLRICLSCNLSQAKVITNAKETINIFNSRFITKLPLVVGNDVISIVYGRLSKIAHFVATTKGTSV